MTRTSITLGALAALTLAGASNAQTELTRPGGDVGIATPGADAGATEGRLSAPTGYPYVSVIVVDRNSGDLKLCGGYMNDGDRGGVACGALPSKNGGGLVVPQRQGFWDL